MAQKEKDALSGVETTGHEWDGLRELNNPLPKWWLYIFYVCIAWSLVYYVLYPAWPLGESYTPIQPVLLGSNERALAASAALQARGFLVGAIRPPSVPEGQARLRVTLNARHTEAEVDALVQALADTCLPLETADA